jgi:hypothetical protein
MRASKISIAAVLVLLSACAQTEAPAPNKNTNWLQECATDAECDEALSCICGVCTERCADEDACAGRDGMGTCRHERSAELMGQCGDAPRWSSVCVAACEDDVDCAYVGQGAHCEHGACIASMNTYVERTSVGVPGDGGADEAPCIPYGDGCAELVATSMLYPSALEARGERVFWLNDGIYTGGSDTVLGSLESAHVSGADRVVLARDLKAPIALALDADHAYFMIRDHEAEPYHTTLVRVPLAGGELEVLLDHGDYVFDAIVVDESNVYGAGYHNFEEPSTDATVWNLYRVSKSGQTPQTEPELVFSELAGRPLEIAKRDNEVYWKDGGDIWALDVTRPGSDRLIVPRDAGTGSLSLYVALTPTDIVWFQRNKQIQISRVDISDPTKVTTSTTTGRFEPSDDFAADENHVWWASPSPIGDLAHSLVRTDKATGETVTIVESALLFRNDFALSDDYVLVTSSEPAGSLLARGFIARFPKGD